MEKSSNPFFLWWFTKGHQIFYQPNGTIHHWWKWAIVGLTVRKISLWITYGGMDTSLAAALSLVKDPSKVIVLRLTPVAMLAKKHRAAVCADKCEIPDSYAIGVAEPNRLELILSVLLGKSKRFSYLTNGSPEQLFELLAKRFNKMIDLKRPILSANARLTGTCRETRINLGKNIDKETHYVKPLVYIFWFSVIKAFFCITLIYKSDGAEGRLF